MVETGVRSSPSRRGGCLVELNVDTRQPAQETEGSLEPGPALDADRRLVWHGTHQYSYSAECECPDDCLRDHEND
jgi:hypothetical protein